MRLNANPQSRTREDPLSPVDWMNLFYSLPIVVHKDSCASWIIV